MVFALFLGIIVWMLSNLRRHAARMSGFTLIELMIVVSIIGILAAIAIPKFADLLRKAREGQLKAQLGTLRSALSIYYSDMEGLYPNGHAGGSGCGGYVTWA